MTVTDRPLTDTDRWVTVSQAARLTGLSERRLRRWIVAGRLPSREGDGGRRVPLETVRSLTEASTVSDGRLPDDSDTVDRQAPDTDRTMTDTGITDLVRLVRDQQRTITELAGRVGFYQAQLQAAQERIALLEAPRPAPADVVPTETTGSPSGHENAPDLASEKLSSGARRPWWAFWRPSVA